MKSTGVNSLSRKIMRLLRRIYLRLFNPPTSGTYFGKKIIFPARHDLVYLTNDLPLYNTQLRRLAAHVRQRDGYLGFLDIGANIGDGIILVGCEEGDMFWAVEGSSSYLPYLEENLGNYSNLILIKKYLSDKAMVTKGGEVTENSTARIDLSKYGNVVFDTLDNIFTDGVIEGPQPNLLKIDIEGHEPKVLNGGCGFIKQHSPVIFMEWFPSLLKLEGGDAIDLLSLLVNYGYVGMIVYDNVGCLYGKVDLQDAKRINEMALYAELKGPHYYFDLILFTPKHPGIGGNFYESEVTFFLDYIKC